MILARPLPKTTRTLILILGLTMISLAGAMAAAERHSEPTDGTVTTPAVPVAR